LVKKLEVDFDEIQKAMEDTARDAFDYFLDIETGDIIVLSEDILNRARFVLSQELDEDLTDYEEVEFDEPPEVPEWMEDEIELALDIFLHEKDRYVRIPEREAESGFRAMQGFAEQLGDPQLKESLLGILNGPGAFRRFKDALDPHPKMKKLWYGFNAKVARDEIREWLRTLSIEGNP
jgi:hypothetical protein